MLIVEIDVDQLMLWLIFMLSLTTVVYLFFDVNYFLRMGFTICWTKLFQNKLKIDETAEVYGEFYYFVDWVVNFCFFRDLCD